MKIMSNHVHQPDDYPGANDYSNAFFAGFFAGITIECGNVIINLDNTKLCQPFWAHTKSGNQPFYDRTKFGVFGAQLKGSSNATIKNGVNSV